MKHETTPALRFLEESLVEVRRQGLLRERPPPSDDDGVSFSSNDYLGLARRTVGGWRAGSGASRLLGGDRPVHRDLERASAELVGQDDALVFSSGYAANVGTIAALAGPGDLVVSDALNHASIIDGARLSRARVAVVPHLDVDAVERALAGRREGRAFVVTESYFSMDADTPDLRALRTLCDGAEAALIVDEAHALGVLGPGGRGICAERGIRPDVLIGTYGKAFGAAGAFVAGCEALTLWLWNRARSFVFSTGVGPAVAAAALDNLRRAAAEPERRDRVLWAATTLRAGMERLGLRVAGYGPILPWILGDAQQAWETASDLQGRGLNVRAVRPPTVPPGTARIRLTVTAEHASADLERALNVLRESRCR